MYITWLGQSGYLLESDQHTICIDAYLSEAVLRAANKKRLMAAPFAASDIDADAVICTHDHLDHLDVDSVSAMCRPKTLFLAPQNCEKKLRSLGIEHYRPFERGSRVTVGNFLLEAVFAEHTVPAVGVIVDCEDKRLYFSGDTLYHAELEELRKQRLDYMFICINGKLGNMNVEEAVRLAKIINPGVAIPNHYGMFAENTENPLLFTKNLNNGFIMEAGRKYEVRECLI